MRHPTQLKSQHWQQFILNAEEQEYFEEHEYLVWTDESAKRWHIIIFRDKNPDYDEKTGQDNSGFRFALLSKRGGKSVNDCETAYPTRELAYKAAYEYWEEHPPTPKQKPVPANQPSLFNP